MRIRTGPGRIGRQHTSRDPLVPKNATAENALMHPERPSISEYYPMREGPYDNGMCDRIHAVATRMMIPVCEPTVDAQGREGVSGKTRFVNDSPFGPACELMVHPQDHDARDIHEWLLTVAMDKVPSQGAAQLDTSRCASQSASKRR